jgi:hypothetical protein
LIQQVVCEHCLSDWAVKTVLDHYQCPLNAWARWTLNKNNVTYVIDIWINYININKHIRGVVQTHKQIHYNNMTYMMNWTYKQYNMKEIVYILLENESHFLLQCPQYTALRQKHGICNEKNEDSLIFLKKVAKSHIF